MLVVGLMSGTSADGIDAALCELAGRPPHVRARVLHARTFPYDATTQRRILSACVPERSRVDVLCQLNADLGEAFAEAVLALLREVQRPLEDIALVGSHGQTVWHMVQPDGRATATLQIGEAAIIAERTGITTVSNFRPRDIAAGGQGAPLTGYADWLLLRHADHWRAVQNIGGMGNVTFLPPLGDAQSAPLAFDTGPGNVLIDEAVRLLSDGAQRYDEDGRMAARGQVDERGLAELLAYPYFARTPPKTTGRELFGAEMAAAWMREGLARGLRDVDIVATLTALTAASIADAYRRFAPAPVREVIIGGGGAHNATLLAMLRERLAPSAVLTHEALGLSSDYKEALVFALLAYEAWHARVGTLPAITGAAHATVLGQITPGGNYAALLRRTWCEER